MMFYSIVFNAFLILDLTLTAYDDKLFGFINYTVHNNHLKQCSDALNYTCVHMFATLVHSGRFHFTSVCAYCSKNSHMMNFMSIFKKELRISFK